MGIRRRAAALLLMCAVAAPVLSAPLITHATRGVVTALHPNEVIVARSKDRGPITLTLTAATHVEGAVLVGAIVSVRYRDDQGHHLATAITVEGQSINGN